MKDPIVIDPPGFDCAAGWQECREYVDKCGGLTHSDGEVNWRAAFGADPGCCSCPHCGEYFWKWGRILQCTECGFTFPSDWWAMYSWGVQQAKRDQSPPPAYEDERTRKWIEARRNESLAHPYYRYGYEHPVEDAWKQHDKIAWREIVGPMGTYPLKRMTV